MPYTFAHPGFSLWLKNKWLKKMSTNGLIFGSISPDFDILFRFTNPRFHLFYLNLITIFVILLPLSILLSFIFHRFVRNIWIDNLPEAISKKLIQFKNFNYVKWFRSNYKIEIASIVFALVLHFLLDLVFHWNADAYMRMVHEGIYPKYSLVKFHYYFGWYFPMIFSTFLGFYLLYKLYDGSKYFTKAFKQDLINMGATKIAFWMTLLFISVLFSFLKLYLFKYEGNGFAWHSLIIYFTSGLIFSFYATPLLFLLEKKLRTVKR